MIIITTSCKLWAFMMKFCQSQLTGERPKKKREKVCWFHQSCILVEPSRNPLRTTPCRSYLGHDGRYSFLYKFFKEANLGLSGAIGFEQNLVGGPSKPCLDELGINTFFYHSLLKPYKNLFGPVGDKTISIRFVLGLWKNRFGPSRFLSPPVGVACETCLDELGINDLFYPSLLKPYKNLFGPSRILSYPVRLFFERLFWPIWTFGLSIESCWGFFQASSRPKKKLGYSSPSNKQPCQSLSGPIWILSHPVRIFLQGLFWPIWTFGLAIESCWGLYPKSTKPKKK